MGTKLIHQRQLHTASNLQGSAGAGGGTTGLGEGGPAGGAWDDSSTIGMGAKMSTELCDTVVVEESISKPNKSTSGGAATGANASRASDLTGPDTVGGSCGVVTVEGRDGAAAGGGGGGAPDIPPNKAAANLSFSNCSAVLTGATGGAAACALLPNPPYPAGAGAVDVLAKVETEEAYGAAGGATTGADCFPQTFATFRRTS